MSRRFFYTFASKLKDSGEMGKDLRRRSVAETFDCEHWRISQWPERHVVDLYRGVTSRKDGILRPPDVERERAQYRWPPSDSTPPHPLEPSGKQFFVYNSEKDVELLGESNAPSRDELYPQWYWAEAEEDLQKSAEGDNVERARTLLCFTDFRRRPMLFLSKDEFEELARNLDEVKKDLLEFQELAKQLQYDDYMKYLETRDFYHTRYDEIRRQKQPSPGVKRAGYATVRVRQGRSMRNGIF